MSRLYIRQTVLPQIGFAGQEKLRKARVLIIGAGGLGCPALAYLAAAGVGTVGVCDEDVVDVTNLHRQILFGVDDIGKQKAVVACAKLQRQYPAIIANPHKERLTAKNAEALVSAYDVVLDCTDNFETKFLLNDVCRDLKKTIIQASVYQFEGQLTASFADGGGQCLRCLWTQTPEAGCVGSCTESGVMGATVGMFGSLQAMEAIKAICGIPSDLHDNMVLFDLLALESRKIRRKVSRSCTLCGEQSRMDFHPTTKAQPAEVDSSSDWQLDILDMSSSELARFVVVDIREPSEDPSHVLQSLLRLAVTSMPLSMLELDSLELNRQKDYLFICQRGRRSDDLVARLRQRGYTNAFSLVGGVEAVRRKFIA
jgi:adenylyltransferase/sulfurtransferase